MTEILLIIIILLLAYMIYTQKHPKGKDDKKKAQLPFRKLLPDYLNKKCEIIVKEPLAAIDVMFNVQGVLVDCDEEWVMLEVKTKRKQSIKMFRIDNISSIKEIVE